MKPRMLWGLLLVVAAGLLMAQAQAPPKVLINDDGAVITPHLVVHRHKGEQVEWARATPGQTAWYVKFVGRNPCQETAGEFGAAVHDQTCHIVAADCTHAGEPSCDYKYTSATAKNGAMHDPDIVVDQ